MRCGLMRSWLKKGKGNYESIATYPEIELFLHLDPAVMCWFTRNYLL